MIRVHIICEGPSEVTFVETLLAPHFLTKNIILSPSRIGKAGHKGGNVRFERLLTDIQIRLKGDLSSYCTTFFDFYGLPPDFPGKTEAGTFPSIIEKSNNICSKLVTELEAHLGSNVMHRFMPYVQMYEYEALLFSDPEKLAKGIFQPQLADEFRNIRDAFESPEEINDNVMTAPGKRIQALVKTYEKPLYGALAAIEIGLTTIRNECKIFDAWLNRLESLSP